MKKILKIALNSIKKLHLLAFIMGYLEDILIISGLTFIVKATFLLSKIAGIYCIGVFLLALGIYFTKFPPQRR